MNRKTQSIVIVGGGLSGLVSSILLCRAGFDVTLVEKKPYPFHRVCGEYVSNEVAPFLKGIGIDISQLGASQITRLAISSHSGITFSSPLDLGGLGISRFTFDHFLYHRAKSEGVRILTNEKVTNVQFSDNQFQVFLSDSSVVPAALVIGAFGKRSNLDQKLQRNFFYLRSPYMGVKYHVRTDFPTDLIQLDNFEGGYCGTVKIEGDKYCICYLAENRGLKASGSIEAMEEEMLFKNPLLKHRFKNSDFLFPKPEVINEISFQRKPLVEDHVLFCGDSAGMIAPLCGNGMAMAIHSAKVLVDIIEEHANFDVPAERDRLERAYISSWNRLFFNRLKAGRILQLTLAQKRVLELAVRALRVSPRVSKLIIGLTHGKPFL